jgi:hypothetical protein
MAALHSFKISGRTSASTDGTAAGIIATKAVEYHDDGSLRFTTAAGEAVIMQPTADLNKLLKLIFVGTGGFATGKTLFGI